MAALVGSETANLAPAVGQVDSDSAPTLACGAVALDDDLRKKREAVCLAHMTAENAHQFEEGIAFFARPQYHLVATGEVWDGADGVARLMQENVTAFPDFHYEVERMHHADDAIVVEGTIRDTHEGGWRGLPATG